MDGEIIRFYLEKAFTDQEKKCLEVSFLYSVFNLKFRTDEMPFIERCNIPSKKVYPKVSFRKIIRRVSMCFPEDV